MGLKLPPRVVAVPCREIGNGEKLEGTKERREGGFVITFFFTRNWLQKLFGKILKSGSLQVFLHPGSQANKVDLHLRRGRSAKNIPKGWKHTGETSSLFAFKSKILMTGFFCRRARREKGIRLRFGRFRFFFERRKGKGERKQMTFVSNRRETTTTLLPS